MKHSSQTQFSALSVKAAGVLLKLLLAQQTSFSFQEIKQIVGIGQSTLYRVLHELRTGDLVDFSSSAPGIPACYHVMITLADFYQTCDIQTDKTDFTDGSDLNGSSNRQTVPSAAPSTEAVPVCTSQPELVDTPMPNPSRDSAHTQGLPSPGVTSGPQVLSGPRPDFDGYGLSAGFVDWVVMRRMEKFHEPAPQYDLLEQHCQYAQLQLRVKYFPNYVAANFLNPDFNYDTPTFWGFGSIAEESGYQKPTRPNAALAECHDPQTPPDEIDWQPGEVSPDIWPRILADLQRRLSRSAFNTWLRPITLLEAAPDHWLIRVPDDVFVYWLDAYYRPILRDTIARHTGTTPDIQFIAQTLGARTSLSALGSRTSCPPTPSGQDARNPKADRDVRAPSGQDARNPKADRDVRAPSGQDARAPKGGE